MKWYKVAEDFNLSNNIRSIIENQMESADYSLGESRTLDIKDKNYLRKLAFSISNKIITYLHTENLKEFFPEIMGAFDDIMTTSQIAPAGDFKDHVTNTSDETPPENFHEGPGRYVRDEGYEGDATYYTPYREIVEQLKDIVMGQLRSANNPMFCGNPMMALNIFNLKKFAAGNYLDPKTRKTINTGIHNIISPEYKTMYFEQIPLQDIVDVLKNYNIIILQEDNTPWSGMLLGDEASGIFPLAYKTPIEPSVFLGTEDESEVDESNKQYEPIKNAELYLYWYKMESGRYEINSYIT